MKKIVKIIFFLIALCATLGITNTVYTQTNNASADLITEEKLSEYINQSIIVEYDGLGEESVSEVPNFLNGALRWIKETFSLLFSLNASNDAVLRLRFGAERINVAEYILENERTYEGFDSLFEYIDSATNHILKLDKKRDKWIGDYQKSKIVFENLSTYNMKVLKLLDDMEIRLPEKYKEDIIKARKKAFKKQINLLAVMARENIPPEVKARINSAKGYINEQYIKDENYERLRDEINRRIISGDRVAESELKELDRERARRVKRRQQELLEDKYYYNQLSLIQSKLYQGKDISDVSIQDSLKYVLDDRVKTETERKIRDEVEYQYDENIAELYKSMEEGGDVQTQIIVLTQEREQQVSTIVESVNNAGQYYEETTELIDSFIEGDSDAEEQIEQAQEERDEQIEETIEEFLDPEIPEGVGIEDDGMDDTETTTSSDDGDDASTSTESIGDETGEGDTATSTDEGEVVEDVDEEDENDNESGGSGGSDGGDSGGGSDGGDSDSGGSGGTSDLEPGSTEYEQIGGRPTKEEFFKTLKEKKYNVGID